MLVTENYEVSQGNLMEHVCNIQNTHESTLMVHYFDEINGTVTVKSPKNIQQCRSTIYKYGLINLMENSECSVFINCDELNGGGCTHKNEGGYNLQLQLRHAWSVKTPQPRPSGQICKGITYKRTLIHNEALFIVMNFHDDPQDRDSTECFTCMLKSTCSTIGLGKDIDEKQVTADTILETTDPSMSSSTSKHHLGRNIPKTYFANKTLTYETPSTYITSKMYLQESDTTTFESTSHNQTEHLIDNTHPPTLGPIPYQSSKIYLPSSKSSTIESSSPTQTLQHHLDSSYVSTSVPISYQTNSETNPFDEIAINSRTLGVSINILSTHDNQNNEAGYFENQTTERYDRIILASSNDQMPTSAMNIELVQMTESFNGANVNITPVMVTSSESLAESLSPIKETGSLDSMINDENVEKLPNESNPGHFKSSVENQNNYATVITQTHQNDFSSSPSSAISSDILPTMVTQTQPQSLPEIAGYIPPTTKMFDLPSSFDKFLSCSQILNTLKAITKELVNLFPKIP